MELTHTFDVPVPPARAFEVLRDIERIGPCMPGATVDDVDGEHFSGRVKVKLGPIQVTYRGEADYVDVDTDALTATINARGREARGSGTANAVVRASVVDGPDGGATVKVVTELAITGKPAQFGRSVMSDVGEKLIGQFADCLAGELAGGDEDADDDEASASADAAAPDASTGQASDDDAAADGETADAAAAATSNGAGPATSSPAAGAATTSARPASTPKPRTTDDAIDLLDVAGAPVAKKLAPAALGALLLYVLYRILTSRKD
ncbi:SRPBCC family protein [Euzebya pacifica]|uniref:SRPBCC family protein n=1 Tax=Euzebya pacifica TaxID=1608957 RepID=UPI0030F79D85